MTKMLTLSCPSCGAKVSLAENASRVYCEHCGNEHLLQINFTPVAREQKPAIRPRIPQPNSVTIEQDAVASRIVQRWFSFKYVPLAFFALIWDAFLVFWYSMALSSGAPVVFVLFPVLHLAIGVWLTYTTLAGFVNRTTIELKQGELSVWFDPLPWPGEKTIRASELKQLYCKEVVKHTRRSTTTSYHLYALTRGDVPVKLLTNLDSPDVALFLEMQLESWLSIENEPVVGEMV